MRGAPSVYQFHATTDIRVRLERIEGLRLALDRRGPLPRLWLGRTRRDLEVEAVAASTRLEGVAVTVDEARRILVGDRPPAVTPEDAELVNGYREAMRYMLARADDPTFSWHTELLLAIHHRILAGAYDREAGRLRRMQNWLTSGETGERAYLPPSPDEVPALVTGLMEWLQVFDGPAPLAAAMAHVRLAGIHPFRDGNRRTARIVASLVMYRAGYRVPQFTSLEEWWGRHISDYYGAFACLGESWDPDRDVTPFIEAHVRAQATQVEALSLRNAVDRVVWTVLEDVTMRDLGLRDRTTNALYDAFFAREVTNRYYRGLSDVSEVTASHDLAKLATSGLLEPRGTGRSTRYAGTHRLMLAVASAADIAAERLPAGGSLEEQRDAVLAAIAERIHAPVPPGGT